MLECRSGWVFTTAYAMPKKFDLDVLIMNELS